MAKKSAQVGPFGWIDNATLERNLNQIMATQTTQTDLLNSLVGLLTQIVGLLLANSTDDAKIKEVVDTLKHSAEKLAAAVAAAKP